MHKIPSFEVNKTKFYLKQPKPAAFFKNQSKNLKKKKTKSKKMIKSFGFQNF